LNEEGSSKVKIEENIVEAYPNIFYEMALIKNQYSKSRKYLYPQDFNKGSEVPKLLISIDYKKGVLYMFVLQPEVAKSEVEIKAWDYDATRIKFDLNKIHVIDKIKWHM
jgi:hypothetical protein